MGSIIGPERPAAHTQQTLTQVPLHPGHRSHNTLKGSREKKSVEKIQRKYDVKRDHLKYLQTARIIIIYLLQ